MLCSRAQQQYKPYNITIKALTVFSLTRRLGFSWIWSAHLAGWPACLPLLDIADWKNGIATRFLHLMKKNAKLLLPVVGGCSVNTYLLNSTDTRLYSRQIRIPPSMKVLRLLKTKQTIQPTTMFIYFTLILSNVQWKYICDHFYIIIY